MIHENISTQGNVEVLDLPADDLDHLRATFLKDVRKINGDEYEPDTLSGLQRSFLMGNLHSMFLCKRNLRCLVKF